MGNPKNTQFGNLPIGWEQLVCRPKKVHQLFLEPTGFFSLPCLKLASLGLEVFAVIRVLILLRLCDVKNQLVCVMLHTYCYRLKSCKF